MAGTKCKYCGASGYGACNDSRHPEKVHVHTHDNQHCIYCGASSLGVCKDYRHPKGCHER